VHGWTLGEGMVDPIEHMRREGPWLPEFPLALLFHLTFGRLFFLGRVIARSPPGDFALRVRICFFVFFPSGNFPMPLPPPTFPQTFPHRVGGCQKALQPRPISGVAKALGEEFFTSYGSLSIILRCFLHSSFFSYQFLVNPKEGS